MLYILTKKIYSKDFFSIEKSLACRRISIEAKQTIRTKCGIFLVVLLYPFYFLSHLKRTKKTEFAVEMSGEKESQLSFPRRIFISHFFNNSDDYEVVQYINGSSIYIHNTTIKKILFSFIVWFRFLQSSFIAVFSKKAQLKVTYIRALNVINTGIFCDSSQTSFFFFRQYSPLSYYTSLVMSDWLKYSNVYAIAGSTFMYTKRYSFFPKVHLCLCSKYQEEEAGNYLRLGWIVCRDVRMTGFEEYYMYKDIKPQEPVFDIGVYSSGWWAREGGVYQSNDIEAIRQYRFMDNQIYSDFLDMLRVLHEIKIKYNLKIKVYPHPYERRLANEYGIECPYIPFLVDKDFAFDSDSQMNSINKIYECNIGISIASTIVGDRWNLGLNAISLTNDTVSSFLKPKYLGKYSKYIISSSNELFNLVPKLLGYDN